MAYRVLITGGGGFIGSHLADELAAHGHRVRILDSFLPQVHGEERAVPAYLAGDVEVHRGDVRDPEAVARALDGIDAVFHFAAMVGVGQSMYQVDTYTSVNELGTAVLLQHLIDRPVEKLVVASSMSIYGEGRYRDTGGRAVDDAGRDPADLKAGRWEPRGADGGPLTPVPTPEDKPPVLASVYALSKYAQERLCLMLGQAYGSDATALRFFNVYGPRQALSNPYTGVLAIFAARLLNGRPPLVFEDGRQRRDFVHVRDVARACRLTLDSPAAVGRPINIGSGQSYTVLEIAERLARAIGRDIAPEVTGRFRAGDIRHCFADTARARDLLGFEPAVALDDGLDELVGWLEGQVAHDRVDTATQELARRGLVA